MDIKAEFDKIEFEVNKSMRYHNYRIRSFRYIFTWVDRIIFIAAILLVILIVSRHLTLAAVCAWFVIISSLFTLLVNAKTKGMAHQALWSKFFVLAQDINPYHITTEEDIRKWTHERSIISSGENPIIDVLDRRCRAEEAIARNIPVQDDWKLTPRQKFWSNFSFR